MLRVTARVLASLPRPHLNIVKHLYIYPKSEEEKALARMPYKKVKYGQPVPDRPIEERISRQLSGLLRHHAKKQGVPMRKDGFVKVSDVLAMQRFHSVDFATLERVVNLDLKKRYTLSYELDVSNENGIWWIRANQGHSIENVEIDMIEVTDPSQVRLAVHGTSRAAWERIAVEGLSRMARLHVHFAQGIPGSGVISGMRTTSEIYIILNVAMALEAGLKLLISSNEVVCCPGDERGFIAPKFFLRVEWAGNRQAIPGFAGPRELPPLEAEEVVKERPED